MKAFGGGQWISGPLNVQLSESNLFPAEETTPDAWYVTIANHNSQEIAVQPEIVCGWGPNLQTLQTTSQDFAAGQYGSITSSCPNGMEILGGGFNSGSYNNGFFPEGVVTDSYPSSSNSWTVWDLATTSGEPTVTLTGYIICGN